MTENWIDGIIVDEIDKSQIMESLDWLREVIPDRKTFDRLVLEGAYGHETTSRNCLTGDDLAGFCHAVATLWAYHGYDPDKLWWMR